MSNLFLICLVMLTSALVRSVGLGNKLSDLNGTFTAFEFFSFYQYCKLSRSIDSLAMLAFCSLSLTIASFSFSWLSFEPKGDLFDYFVICATYLNEEGRESILICT